MATRRWSVSMLLLFVVSVVIVPAGPAWAHAALTGTEPADGARLDGSPREVELVFNEPVEVPVAAIRVFDSGGGRVDLGDAGPGGAPRTVRVSVPELADGAYIVTWRVVSTDSHPVRGAFVFEVGAGGTVDESLITSLLGGDGAHPAAVVAWLLRAIAYAGVLAAAGGVVFLLAVAARPLPQVGALVRRAAEVGVAASALQIPVFALESTGLGWQALTSASAWTGAITSSLALAAAVRVAGLLVLRTAVERLPAGWAWTGVSALVVAELLTGHTRTTEPMWLVMAADAVHLVGAAVWVGGVAALAAVLLSRSHRLPVQEGARIVGRFSTLAVAAVVALTVAGLSLAWMHVGAVRALTTTAYGWALVAKTAAVALVLGFSLYNHRVLVPSITDPGQASAGAWERLQRTVRVELVGLAAVVAVTAMLVNLQPAGEAAGVAGPFSTYVPFGEYQLNLVVDPNRAGDNELHLYVLTPGGLPALVAGEADVEFSMPAEDIGPIVRTLQLAGPGHYLHVGPELAIPGEWVITVRQRISQFDEQTAEVEVTVNR